MLFLNKTHLKLCISNIKWRGEGKFRSKENCEKEKKNVNNIIYILFDFFVLRHCCIRHLYSSTHIHTHSKTERERTREKKDETVIYYYETCKVKALGTTSSAWERNKKQNVRARHHILEMKLNLDRIKNWDKKVPKYRMKIGPFDDH